MKTYREAAGISRRFPCRGKVLAGKASKCWMVFPWGITGRWTVFRARFAKTEKEREL